MCTDKVIITPVGCGMELLADMMIMLGTIFYLRKGQQSDYPSFRLNLAMSKLITYAAKTGIPINIFTILTIIAFISDSKGLLYAPFFFVLARRTPVYSCSFMTILNSRKKVRAVMSGPDNTSNCGGPMPLVDVSGARGVPGIGFVVETKTDMPDDIVVSLDKPDRPNESQGK